MPLSAASFLNLFLSESKRREDRAPEKGSDAWSQHAWAVLHATAHAASLYCACSMGHADQKIGEKREWLWDLTWYDRQSKVFSPPLVIIEHENSHSDQAFLDDFWKVMVGHAPLRVMIGYTRKRTAALGRRVERIRCAVQGWVMPADAEDLILLRQYGLPKWHVLHRAPGVQTFGSWPNCSE